MWSVCLCVQGGGRGHIARDAVGGGPRAAFIAACITPHLSKTLLPTHTPHTPCLSLSLSFGPTSALSPQVWSGIRCRGGSGHRHHHQSLLGGLFPFPSQFAWAPTLALTHLLVPQASFTAHIAGVAAGLMRGYALQPGVCVCGVFVCVCVCFFWGGRGLQEEKERGEGWRGQSNMCERAL